MAAIKHRGPAGRPIPGNKPSGLTTARAKRNVKILTWLKYIRCAESSVTLGRTVHSASFSGTIEADRRSLVGTQAIKFGCPLLAKGSIVYYEHIQIKLEGRLLILLHF